MASSMSANSNKEEAERLRLRGNDAFSTKDWERAIDLYQQSIERFESSKAYSNLSATLSKQSRYVEALHAAKRATELDPEWAKAWWRRGLAEELLKSFADAMKHYSIAVKLDPKEKTFRKALENCAQRYGIKGGVNADSHTEMEGKNANKFDMVATLPYYKAWKQFRNETDGNPFIDLAFTLWCHQQNGKPFPTSQQYFVFGLQEWVKGMERAVAYLVLSAIPEAQPQLQALKAMAFQTGMNPIELRARTKELIGGDEPNGVDGDPLQELSNGFAYLEGKNLHLETGGEGLDVPKDDMLVPPPDILTCAPFQHLSILGSIVSPLQFLSQKLGGRKMKSSQALLQAAKDLFASLRFDGNDTLGVAATPKEAVDFIEIQLQAGKTWDGALRRYVSLQYRGTILYGAILRFTGMVAECHKYESWAKEFIELADAKFHVTEDQAYNEKGNTFRPSIRTGFMLSMLHTHMSLGGGRLYGAYPMSDSIDLCLEVIKLAQQFESSSSTEIHNGDFLHQFNRLLMDYSCRRKPLAVAKSYIGHMLTKIWSACGSANDFWHVAAHHGFVDSASNTSCDPHAIIAEFYHGAAEAEIPDADECAIFWWAYAANMAQAEESSGFTVGKLRTAIRRAEEAEKARDVALFGLNPQRGGTHETVARVAERHFVDKSESFILPAIRVTEGQVFVGDEVICDDFDKASKVELGSFSSKPKGDDSWMDTAALEKEHGQMNEGIPDLQTLCVRELHRAGCEFAEGESDPAVIHLNAIMSWQQEEKERS